jgi:hypothetical protein
MHIGEEVHVDLDLAIALAFLTASAGCVEGEAPGSKPRCLASGSFANSSRMGVKTPV